MCTCYTHRRRRRGVDGGERSKRRMAATAATEPPRIKEQLLLILLHFLLLLAFKSEKYYEREEEEEEMRETGRVRMRKEERRGVEDGERGGKFASFMHIFSLSRKLACHFCQPAREREERGPLPPSYMLRTVHLLPACVRYPARGEASYSLFPSLHISPSPFLDGCHSFFPKRGEGEKKRLRGRNNGRSEKASLSFLLEILSASFPLLPSQEGGRCSQGDV